MYQETLQFYHQWRLAVQERDEAREHLKHSLAKLSQLQELFNTILLSEEKQIPNFFQEATRETTTDSPSPFSSAPPPNLVFNSSPAISDSGCYSFQSNQMGFVVANTRDYESVVLEMIGGVLPENGKFLETVIRAGPLVESSFITGPVPNLRNHPIQLSSQRAVITGNWNYGGMELGSGILNRALPGKMSHLSLINSA